MLLLSFNTYSLEVVKNEPLDFGYISDGKVHIPAYRGSKIYVEGIPGKRVKVESERSMTFESKGTVLRLDKISFHKDEIVLDRLGRGVFKVGGILSVKRKRRAGNMENDLWVRFKYVD